MVVSFRQLAKGQTSALVLFLVALFISGCASDRGRLRESRDAFLQDNFGVAESSLYTPEVYQNDQNRLMHFYLLGSVAMSQGHYEKSIYFLNRARTLALTIRSQSGVFEWFSAQYSSNPIEFSYLHYLLVMSYQLLAAEGASPAWSIPELKDKNGNGVVAGQNFPARQFDAKEIADFRQKARAELIAWDTFLQTLKKAHSKEKLYHEDGWARLLASFFHAQSQDQSEKRTAEILSQDARKVFERNFSNYPTEAAHQESILSLIDRMKTHAAQNKKTRDTLFVLEAGIMRPFKKKRFVVGLSTLFSKIQDPGLRMMLERVGIEVLMHTAPEFGLIAFGGAMAGAIEGNTGNADEDEEFDGPPRFFTDAVDQSFGFQIQFPSLLPPPSDTRITLALSREGKNPAEILLPIVSPLQELIAVELKNREDKEMFARAVSIGSQYLAVLIPAIIEYRRANQEGNGLKKFGILAGYYIAKKVIDRANEPDLRSWSFLPKVIASDLIKEAPGNYLTRIKIENSFGKFEKDLGLIEFGNPKIPMIRKRIGDLSILNHSSGFSTDSHASSSGASKELH